MITTHLKFLKSVRQQYLITLALVVLSINLPSGNTIAQVTNSFSPDKQGMYFYSIDTLIQIVNMKQPISKIVVNGYENITTDFPEQIAKASIIIPESNKKLKKGVLKTDDIIFTLKAPVVEQGTVKITILTSIWNGKGFSLFERGAYTFFFKYIPENNHYTLEKIVGG